MRTSVSAATVDTKAEIKTYSSTHGYVDSYSEHRSWNVLSSDHIMKPNQRRF